MALQQFNTDNRSKTKEKVEKLANNTKNNDVSFLIKEIWCHKKKTSKINFDDKYMNGNIMEKKAGIKWKNKDNMEK